MHPFRGMHTWAQPPHSGLLPQEADAFYVLEQRHGGTLVQRGVIGATELAAAGDGLLPHEDVIPAKVDLHHRLTRLTGGCVEPVLLGYRGGPQRTPVLTRATSRQPDWEFTTTEGTTNRVWICTDPAQQAAIREGIEGRVALIADGHHRVAAARRHRETFAGAPGPWDRVLALLVDVTRHPLQLTAIDRLLPGLDPVWAAAEAARVATVSELPTPPRRPVAGELVLVGSGRCWSITAPRDEAVRAALAGLPDAWASLDVAVLHHLFLTRIWEVPADGDHVRYLRAREGSALPAAGAGSLLLVAPPSEASVWRMAAAGVRLPAKSTSFGPKPMPWQIVYHFASQHVRERSPAAACLRA